MTRSQLEHLIRAAATIAGDDEIVVVGSRSILGQFPDAPAELRVSMEAVLWPRNTPERWELIDGSIGELSPFHETFGYYAQGVGPETSVLPEGWQERLVPVYPTDSPRPVGLCLEIHDLAAAKYAAGREKDMDFAQGLIRHGMIERRTLLRRVETLPLDDDRKAVVANLVTRDFGRRS